MIKFNPHASNPLGYFESHEFPEKVSHGTGISDRVNEFARNFFRDLAYECQMARLGIIKNSAKLICWALAGVNYLGFSWFNGVQSYLEAKGESARRESFDLSVEKYFPEIIKRTRNKLRDDQKNMKIAKTTFSELKEKHGFLNKEDDILKHDILTRDICICAGVVMDIAIRVLVKDQTLNDLMHKYDETGAPMSAALYHRISSKAPSPDHFKNFLYTVKANLQRDLKEVEDLSEGYYEIVFKSEKETKKGKRSYKGHEIAYIQSSSGKGVVVDPNLGFLMCRDKAEASEVIQRIRHLMHNYCKEMQIFLISKSEH